MSSAYACFYSNDELTGYVSMSWFRIKLVKAGGILVFLLITVRDSLTNFRWWASFHGGTETLSFCCSWTPLPRGSLRETLLPGSHPTQILETAFHCLLPNLPLVLKADPRSYALKTYGGICIVSEACPVSNG